MSEQTNTPDSATTEQNAPVFQIRRVYLKDLSLEVPNAPQVLFEPTSPGLEIGVDLAAQRLADTVFEVSLTVTLTAKTDDKVVFLVEGKQAGIFEIANFPEGQLDQMIWILCPSILQSYLRANLADALTRATLQPVHFADFNFQAMYEDRLRQLQEQAQASEQAATEVKH